MGYLADIIKSIWEDGPLGNPTQPSKPRIRNELAPAIESALVGATAGLVLAWDWAELQTKVGTRNGQPGRVEGPDAGTHTDTVLGGTVPNRGNYAWYAPTSKWRWISVIENFDNRLTQAEGDIDALEVSVAGVNDKIPALAGQKAVRYKMVTGLKRDQKYFGGVHEPGGIKTYAVGDTFEREFNPGCFVGWIRVDPSATEIGMRVVRRPLANGNGSPTGVVFPGVLSGDRTLQPITWSPIKDVLKDPGTTDQFQAAVVRYANQQQRWSPGFIYFSQLYARNAAGAFVDIKGIAYGATPVNADVNPLWQRGLYSSDPSITAGGEVVSGGMLAHAIMEATFLDGNPGAGNGVRANPYRVALDGPPKLFQADTVNGAWRFIMPKPSIDLWPDPLANTRGGFVELGIAKLSNANNFRYDVVSLSPVTGDILTYAGPERSGDASMFRPDNTGFARLGYFFVTGAGVEFIPTNDWNGFVRRGEEDRFAAWAAMFRNRLGPFLGLMRSSSAIRYMTYGDSIQAISNGETADWLVPNGTNRDRIEYLFGYGADARALVPRFDGPNGVNGHAKIASHWWMLEQLEKHYGCMFDVVNMSIGGTLVDTGTTGDGKPNALNPQRLNAAIALKPHVVEIHFGMNQRLDVDYYSKMRSLIQAFKAAGIIVIVHLCPLPNKFGGTTQDWWLFQVQEGIRACDDEGVAYVDPTLFSGTGREGAMGLSTTTACEANTSNHPGFTELKFRGLFTAAALTSII
ncbi:SGNH/GDSL hydrolase family protein [Rhizobium sp. DKSPLA3]|uniref:SGNH/GDSL hydrolase family protein n=1 Tax=Rhizobium quercicola TaxID=2901226 RepID=A0A9X1NU19_9HYPH|nr:SGNH/GDSL hydrolase family protein [Rhizobium quercicola]MCD7109699.1 SGNH/GDSL hydrolase family protein [Rhizobium quercicola]